MGKKKNIFMEGAISPLFIAESISKHSGNKDIGAHSIFLGQVRTDIIDGMNVSAIEYSAYEEMALEIIHEIREDIFLKYKLICLHIYHSLGIVKSGEICLFVFTSSEHRKDAVKACEEIVERIKTDIPVWGKELLENNEFVWKKDNQSRITHG